jgi:hypothetical protein
MNVVQSAALDIVGARIIGDQRTNASGGELEMKLADYAYHRIMPIWRTVAAERWLPARRSQHDLPALAPMTLLSRHVSHCSIGARAWATERLRFSSRETEPLDENAL